MTAQAENRKNYPWFVGAGLAASLLIGGFTAARLTNDAFAGTVPPATATPDGNLNKVNLAFISNPEGEMVKKAELSELKNAMDGTLAFLQSQYDPDVGLLRASTEVEYNKHYLNTDNTLALDIMLQANPDDQIANSIKTTLDQYGNPQHGVITVMSGDIIEWPPHVPQTIEVGAGVFNESRLSGPVMEDWYKYTDLSIYGAMNEFNKGNIKKAETILVEAFTKFDGYGFTDDAYDKGPPDPKEGKLYDNYKLALAIQAANKIGIPYDPRMLQRLLEMQLPNGGIPTKSSKSGGIGDPNTETASHVYNALASEITNQLSAKKSLTSTTP